MILTCRGFVIGAVYAELDLNLFRSSDAVIAPISRLDFIWGERGGNIFTLRHPHGGHFISTGLQQHTIIHPARSEETGKDNQTREF
jgi:hypothetical protein